MEVISYIFIFLGLYFEVFLIISFLEKKPINKENNNCELPEVTIIVPCFNEQDTISGTIHSLLRLNYPKEKLSIFVINDGSTDNTQKTLEQFRETPQIRLLEKENGGKYTALNLGISLAKTPFIGCLDADSFVNEDALVKMVSHFQDKNIMAVIPSIVVAEPKTFIQKMQKAEYNLGVFIRQALSIIWAIFVTPGPFSFFRKEVFDIVGEYRHAYNTEDLDMALRMQKKRMKILHVTDIVVHTSAPETIHKLYKQRVRWTSGFLDNIMENRDMIGNKKYWDLWVLVFPFALVAILFSVPLFSISVINSSRALWTRIEKAYFSGIYSWPFTKFDPFFIDINTINLLSLVLLAITIIMLLWSKKIIDGKWKINWDIFYFLFFRFLSVFWIGKSIYNHLLKKQTTWK